MKKIFFVVTLSTLLFSCTSTCTKVDDSVTVELSEEQLSQKIVAILKSDIPHEQRIQKAVYYLKYTLLPADKCMSAVKGALHTMGEDIEKNKKFYFMINENYKALDLNEKSKKIPRKLLVK
tara:strand:+ start:93 stop:455 length:363 start_codon:yes stop_codon:yes gene_type:complete